MLPLVLLPGLLCDKALWQAQIQALAPRPMLAPTLDQQDSIEALASAVLDTAPPYFALAGLSMGGYVAMAIMRQAPERVRKLALIDTSARPDTPEQLTRRQALIALAKSGKFKGVTPRLLPLLIHHSRLDDPSVTTPILAMAARIGRDGFVRQQTAIMGRTDSRPYLAQINCPTLIIVGADDQLTPLPIAEELATHIPQARLVVLPDCGHLPPLEQPERTTALLQEWLD